MTVAAIVLAAGSSTRMGARNKLTALIDGRPVVARAVAALRDGGAAPIVVVAGHQAEAVIAAAADAAGGPIESVVNPAHLEGVGTSIAAGVAALGDRAGAVLIALGDMPSIDPRTVAALIAAHRDTPNVAIAPERDGRRGHPVLFPASSFAELATLAGDRGARRVFESVPNQTIAVDDPGIHRDVDTPADLDSYAIDP